MIYPDSSFLISLYSLDVNSAAAARAMSTIRSEIVVSPLVEFEVMNSMQLRVFRKEITTASARMGRKSFDQDIQAGFFRPVPLPPGLFARAKEISERTTATPGTRTIDLLHVAAALELGAEAFYSFDERQRKLARALRLKLN